MTDDVLDLSIRIRTIFTGAFGGGTRDQVCAVLEDNSLRCFGISNDGQSMWWWFTQGSFVAPGEQAMVGDFNGDGKKDVFVYRPSDGNVRIFALRSTGAFFDPLPFTLGNLAGLDLRNKIIRVGEFGQNSARSDLVVIDPVARQLFHYDSAPSGTPTFWWAFTTNANQYSTSEDVTVANIAGEATDDLVFRNRSTGAYRFTKFTVNSSFNLNPITNVSVGQLPTTAGGRVYWAKAGVNPSEPGGTIRDDAFYISNGWLVRTDARWDGTRRTYWWAYSKNAPKYTRSHRTLASLTAAERTSLSNMMRTYITEAVISEHAAGHDWHHPTNESFFYQHRRFITSAEKFLLSQGGSLFVPMPMWDPNTQMPTDTRQRTRLSGLQRLAAGRTGHAGEELAVPEADDGQAAVWRAYAARIRAIAGRDRRTDPRLDRSGCEERLTLCAPMRVRPSLVGTLRRAYCSAASF